MGVFKYLTAHFFFLTACFVVILTGSHCDCSGVKRLTLVVTSSVYRMRCFDGLRHVGEAAWGAPESFLRLPAREVMSLGRSRDLKRHQIINIGRSSHGRSSAFSK